ncbi:anthranilate synthase component I family protein [Gillisia limnaea]|uniref:Chorismate binding domain-containing protein n=1 Tax=Gillisia limnaea (strain DSM 15749 / LMG 21470 / R-8282) TaxID=865937 RepID=H2BRD7_GILLR|nr:anthranilate synthase component I family protein [Gillisia limnaea]EHQ04456.1 Chorismate binding domain-containing protein [Gillisia limnaea DSM 15749]
MRTTKEYILKNPLEFKEKLLEWSRQFDEIAWLDSNEYDHSHSDFDAVLAVQAFTVLKTDFHKGFSKLQEYQEVTKDWIFGYLSYDLKNDVEQLSSRNYDNLHFPDLYFFQPAKVIQLKGETAIFRYLKMVDDEMKVDFEQIDQGENFVKREENSEVSGIQKTEIQSRISREQYLKKVNDMLSHIHRGDIYEANFCQEFFAENRTIEPFEIFKNLNKISIPPFAVFLKLESNYLLCASPERYLKKSGSEILSQPIKGTAKRAENLEEDLKIAIELSNDLKERSENVMIVDLVRNDLSKVAKRGSVQVDELCRVYSFKQVHQMISTVSAELEDGIPTVEVLRATFPMGSMTGAPKISAMKIIEELEETKRGLYSGAVGYFTPEGDFDFNVVIRSILYNSERKYVSFSVGGAITSKSIPEKEYEECLLKSEAMREVLKG